MTLKNCQIEQFQTEGYLLVEDALAAADLAPVIDEYAAYIDRRAHELLAQGRISQLYADEPFARRLADSLQRRLGDGTQVLTEEGDAPRLWVSPARPGAAWLGFRIPAFRTQAMHLSAVVLVAALLIVLATAWWLRLELVRPLRALSDQAPALASGELEAPPHGAGGWFVFGARKLATT